jgi:hypothetical protein
MAMVIILLANCRLQRPNGARQVSRYRLGRLAALGHRHLWLIPPGTLLTVPPDRRYMIEERE